MKNWPITIIICTFLVIFASGCITSQIDSPTIKQWTVIEDEKPIKYMTIDGMMVHEADPEIQPQPKIVTPGKNNSAPSDAIVLFDGTKDSFINNWTDTQGNPTKWKLVDGAMESVDKAGYIQTKQKFGSCQLHVEWASPTVKKGKGQGMGNSGVFLMSIYEVQVLDSYNNITYPDGQAGAIYGRSKPLVNASRPAGQWQSYDIIFRKPLFDDQGNVTKKATFTILHNGLLIQDNYHVTGATGWQGPHAVTEYYAHPDKLPIQLQDHGNPVRFKNIWIRELKD